jgi:uncharacterized protein (DUF1015 family)
VAEVRPFRALRYAPGLDLPNLICPPFDTISPQQQRLLHGRSDYNAVRIELAEDGEERYRAAARTLAEWLSSGVLRRDERAAFYLYRQTFSRGGTPRTRTILFARLRLTPWDKGEVLPHEQTFGGPKEDRLKLLRATRLNTSPVYLLYRDPGRLAAPLLDQTAAAAPPQAEFSSGDGQEHALWVLDEPLLAERIQRALSPQTLYVADGHHRYETALAYRDEVRDGAEDWTGDEPENFVLAALTAADDPGLLVLPIHRVTRAPAPLENALRRLEEVFHVRPVRSLEEACSALGEAGGSLSVFALAAAERPELLVLTPRSVHAGDRFMPEGRSQAWRSLDYAIANHVILQYGLALEEEQMQDYSSVWFTEDAAEAVEQVRSGRARYAILMNPVPVGRVLAIADSGERMPQKSTFFYPKVPAGLVFSPLEG